MSEPIDPIMCAQSRMRDALDRVRPRLAALDRTNLSSVNLDPFAAAAQVRGAMPGLLSLRAELIETFNGFTVTNLDLLETYALALLQAETVYRAVTAKPEETAFLLKEAFELRKRLVADTTVLAERRLVAAPELSNLRVPNGYRSIGADLLSLSTLLRDNWPSIAGNTPIQLTELDRAEILAEQLLCAIASRKRRTVAAKAAADDRQRAFTLMVDAYDEVRRAIVYLRRNAGDAERIAPSLYRKRKTGRAKSTANRYVEEHDAARDERTSSDATDSAEWSQGSSAPRARTKITDPFIH